MTDLRAVGATVALCLRDDLLRARLASAMKGTQLLAVGPDSAEAAVVIVTDAPRGSARAVSDVRARARTDAAIIVILPEGTPASEFAAARTAGALLCLKQPLDEHHLLGVIESAVDLQGAKAYAGDLARKLDLHTHLASIGRVTANFMHELSNPLSTLKTNFEMVRAGVEAQLRGDEPPPRLDLAGAMADMAEAFRRIDGIVATVRTLTRGGCAPTMETVDLAAMVREVLRWASADLDGVHVQELVDEHVVAMADPRLLGQILVNLVANAAHAARQFSHPRVRLHVYEDDASTLDPVDGSRSRVLLPGPSVARDIATSSPELPNAGGAGAPVSRALGAAALVWHAHRSPSFARPRGSASCRSRTRWIPSAEDSEPWLLGRSASRTSGRIFCASTQTATSGIPS